MCPVGSRMVNPEKDEILVLRKGDGEVEIYDDYVDHKLGQGAIWMADTYVDWYCSGRMKHPY